MALFYVNLITSVQSVGRLECWVGVTCQVTPGSHPMLHSCSVAEPWRPGSPPGVMIHIRFFPVKSDRGFHASLARGSSHTWVLQHRPHILAASRCRIDPNDNPVRDGSESENTRPMSNTLTRSSPSHFSFSNRLQSHTEKVRSLLNGRPITHLPLSTLQPN